MGRILDMPLWRTPAARNARANQLVIVALVWLGIVAGATFLFLFNPSNPSNQIPFPVCPFFAITGFACPGCGTTRGLHHLLHGDLITAFRFNPLMMVMLPFLLYALLRYTNAVMRGQPIRGNQLNAKYIWLLFFVILAFWIGRNTPFYPFPI